MSKPQFQSPAGLGSDTTAPHKTTRFPFSTPSLAPTPSSKTAVARRTPAGPSPKDTSAKAGCGCRSNGFLVRGCGGRYRSRVGSDDGKVKETDQVEKIGSLES
ncbi:hypothetical protein FIBSPDRAFT_320060 [Athelia psychrophila]|uniref:Uncharacterized protein n=1 Tax=Athelia psychrophila TaxID=1759441 RepID=A0A166QHD1_9AGAM|nr:hypothetical protein FIBSPDRAFT_320060 [Fibularhizoctonia sp. CBS 109695]